MAKKVKKEKLNITGTEDSIEVRKFIMVLCVVVIVVCGIYLFTRIFITKDLFNKDDNTGDATESETVNFDYNKTILGLAFNRPYDEYYVIIYDSTNVRENVYTTILTMYKENTNPLKIYMADLDNPMNTPFLTEEATNPKAKTASELKVKSGTLIRIKNGKITKYLEDLEAIKTELKKAS